MLCIYTIIYCRSYFRSIFAYLILVYSFFPLLTGRKTNCVINTFATPARVRAAANFDTGRIRLLTRSIRELNDSISGTDSSKPEKIAQSPLEHNRRVVVESRVKVPHRLPDKNMSRFTGHVSSL